MSADGERWFLCNASPDVREQLTRLPLPRHVGDGVRRVPIEGIVLTDAELDHTLGIALLREAGALSVYATAAVARTIERDSRLLPVTRAFARVALTELALDTPTQLRDRERAPSGLTVEPFAVPGDAPRFASEERPGHTVGLLIRDERTGTSCAFVPGCGALDDAVTNQVIAADLVLFDGTFWSDDELVRLGIGERTATAMGHVPITGPGGSLARLVARPARRTVYTHINNTNRVLLEESAERRAVEAGGVVVGMDGMQFEV
jgi:pyrroloquinoline quinone biosynthesis protein B